MPSLVSGKQFQDRGRQQMRGGMPVDRERLRVLRRQDLQLGIVLKGTREVPKLSIDARNNRIIR